MRREKGSLETEVLTTLWSSSVPLAGAEVHERIDAPNLSYKTVLTVLIRLQAKGLVVSEKAGRAYMYRPVPDKSDVAAERMAGLLARGADRSAVLQGFLDAIDPNDEAILRELLLQSRADGAP